MGRKATRSNGWLVNGTHLFVKGHASCIAEGLSLPWFFSMLDEHNIDYDMWLELHGAPCCLLLDPCLTCMQSKGH